MQHRWALAHIVDAKHHIVFDEVKTSFMALVITSFCVRKRNDVDLKSNDVASKLANDVVSCGHKHKNKRTTEVVLLFLAPPVGLEPTTCGLTVRRSTD